MFYHGNMNDEEAYLVYLAECDYYEEEKKQDFEREIYYMIESLVDELGAEAEMAEYVLNKFYYDYNDAKTYLQNNYLNYESFRNHVYSEFQSLKSSHYKDDFETFLATDYQNSDFMAAFLSENDVNIYFSDPIIKDKDYSVDLNNEDTFVSDEKEFDEYEFC